MSSGRPPGTPPGWQPWTAPDIDCETARASMAALLVDERDPSVDRRALDAHLARCEHCAWPAALAGPSPSDPHAKPPLRRTRRRYRLKPGAGYLIALVLLVLAAVIFGPAIYFHTEGKAPAKLTLPVGPGGATGPLDGTWSPGPGSAAEYRVDEVLFDQSHLAVGRTSEVSGTMTIAGATVTSGHIVVNLASIRSGQAGRDTVFRDHLLDTSSHPDAIFTLTRAIDLGTVPADGSTTTVQAVGTLQLRGVTRPVTFPLTAKRLGGQLDVTGDLTIRFGQWHIPDPSFAITKVSPTGDIDLLVDFQRR